MAHAAPRWLAPLVCAVLAASGCTGGSSSSAIAADAQQARDTSTAETSRPSLALPDFATLVEQHESSVVNVEAVGQARATAGPSVDDPLLDFFRRFGIPAPDFGPQVPPQILRGAGSGFIVSEDGYVLTNAHVVAQADEVTVRLTDRREFQARVVGTDARTDVAVLKIDARDLPAVRLGDPGKLRTGDWVLAIGSPFGLDSSATAGIVSATARAVSGELEVPFIQTDVAVNPGNSGGPLFNLQGEVVGINSMIFSRTGGYMGISFAIPIDVAMQVRDQLVETGRVIRGRIGVTVQNVDAALARSFGLDRPRGALVSSVDESAPAAKAGLKPGDIVLRANEEAIERSSQLARLITRTPPGTEVMLTVWRAGKERQIGVRVAELIEEGATQGTAGGPSRQPEEEARLGLGVRLLTPEEKQAAGTKGSIVIASVAGPAARAGVQPGDIVLAVNDSPVRTVRELRDATARLKSGDTAALLIERAGAQGFVPVRVG